MILKTALLGAVLAMSLGASVYAQGTNVGFGAIRQDTDAPVEVTADNLSVDQNSGTAIFTGNVIIGQGEMRLSADKVRVIYNATQSGIDRLIATGGVTLVSGPDAAEAENADYDVASGVIVMTGDVLLTQGLSALTSNQMTVNLDDGTARMTGQVKTILQTGNN